MKYKAYSTARGYCDHWHESVEEAEDCALADQRKRPITGGRDQIIDKRGHFVSGVSLIFGGAP